MAANKVPTVRATVATGIEMAKMARRGNDANIVCIGTRILAEGESALGIIEAFLAEDFAGDSHDEQCVDKLKGMCEDRGN